MSVMEQINDPEVFYRNSEDWNNLAKQLFPPFFFHTSIWLRVWFNHFNDDNDLHVLMHRDGDTLVGAAPLMFGSKRLGGMPARRMDLIGASWTGGDLLAPEATKHQFIEQFVGWLDEHRKDWDVLVLTNVSETSPTVQFLPHVCREAELTVETEPGHSCLFTSTEQGWEKYWNSRTRKHRDHIKYYQRRIDRIGGITFRKFNDIELFPQGLDAMFAIWDRSWKAKQADSAGDRERFYSFYKCLGTLLASTGGVDLTISYIADKPVAYTFSAVYQNRLFGIDTAFDDDYGKYSPGSLLFHYLVQNCFQVGPGIITLGVGPVVRYKRWLSTSSQKHHHLYIFSRTARARLLHFHRFRVHPLIHRQEDSGATQS